MVLNQLFDKFLTSHGLLQIFPKKGQTMGYQEMRDFLNDKGNNTSSFNIDQPLNTLGGLGKEFKGNIQDTNILGHLENDYRGKMTDGQRTNIKNLEIRRIFLRTQ